MADDAWVGVRLGCAVSGSLDGGAVAVSAWGLGVEKLTAEPPGDAADGEIVAGCPGSAVVSLGAAAPRVQAAKLSARSRQSSKVLEAGWSCLVRGLNLDPLGDIFAMTLEYGR